MDTDTTDLRILLKLNQKGLISDEILAKALNERYSKEYVVEKTEAEKRQELIDSVKSMEEKTKNELQSAKDEIEGIKKNLTESANTEETNLDHNVEEKEIESSLKVNYNYIDNIEVINIIKQSNTIILALAKDEYGEEIYAVYQNRHDVVGFNRIDLKPFKYIKEAEQEYEERVDKEEKELAALYDEPEKAVKDNSEYSFAKPDLVDTKLKISNSESPKVGVIDDMNNFVDTNDKSEYSFAKPDLVDTKLKISNFESSKARVIDNINKLGDEADPELDDLNKAAEKITKSETDTKFETVEAGPERMEKLKSSKRTALVKGLKILGVVAAARVLLAAGTGLLEVGILTGTGVFSYNYFAKKIREGTWEPKNGIEKFMKYSTEKIMNLGNSESKVK